MSSTKKKRTTPHDPVAQTSTEPAKYTTKTGIKQSVRIIPRNIHQEEYLESLLDPKKMIVLAQKPSTQVKTTMGMLAAIKAFSEKKIKKIILCRPAIGVDDENHGFLPGTLDEKMAPWVIPLIDVVRDYYSEKDILAMIEAKTIEIAPLMYMRGRNLKDCFIIADEFQNSSISQCKTLFSRICDNTKIIVTGDNEQSDRKTNENGMLFFKNALINYGECEYISNVEFDYNDIQRHPVVSEVLKIFKMAGK